MEAMTLEIDYLLTMSDEFAKDEEFVVKGVTWPWNRGRKGVRVQGISPGLEHEP